MYNYVWDTETGGYLLTTKMVGVTKELRPVFYEELDLLGFDKYWRYPKTEKPLMWAETRRYIYKGQVVAEATGGGLFTNPTLNILQEGLEVEPVNISLMIEKNEKIMTGLVQQTVEKIYKTFNEYKDKNIDVIYVAFSGGKDSLVLLDLVEKTLPSTEFKVVFGDTTMEVSDTYEAVKKAQERWPSLDFYVARSHMDARETWDIFGPPSRTQRWCCSVHKSVPSLLKLKELVKKKGKFRALVFDGVRAEESETRATYMIVSDGNKHVNQVNCSPLLGWGSDELFLYIFQKKLLLNNAYRYGSTRVGCAICPMSSPWRDFITNTVYSSDTAQFLEKLERYAKKIGVTDKQLLKYIEKGGWRARAGGRGLDNAGGRIFTQRQDNISRFFLKTVKTDWKKWIKILGDIIEIAPGEFTLEYKGKKYVIKETREDDLLIEIVGSTNQYEDKRFNYCIKNIFNKAVYCVGCKECVVECPTGALKIDNNVVSISNNCIHCEKCLEIRRGCLVANSLYVTNGGQDVNNLRGMNRYGTFGFRQEWLKYLSELGEIGFWKSDKLGPDQFDGFKKWLIDSEIWSKSNMLTETGQEILSKDINDPNIWAMISVNLAYNSIIFKWYINNVEKSVKYTKADYMLKIGDDYNKRTRSNALNALINTFVSSPIGKELGIGVCERKGKKVASITRTEWEEPESLAILYSLYRFAEKCDGYYSFTLSYLCDDTVEREGISPSKIFGIDMNNLKSKLQGLANDYPEFISVTFNKDLDNIDLNKDKTSIDVIKLV